MPFGSGSDDATLFAGTVDGVWCLTDGGEPSTGCSPRAAAR